METKEDLKNMILDACKDARNMKKETRLNDNEVREVARMQQRIDSYEGFISAAFIMAKTGKHMNYLTFPHTEFSHEMNFIWKTIKEKCINNEGTKDSKAT